MVTEKDIALMEHIISGTQNNTIHWEATAVKEQFTTSFRGKYSVLVDRMIDDDGQSEYYSLTLKDSDDRELLRVYSGEVARGKLRDLYQLAQRESLSVDHAIDEILAEPGSSKEISDEDIPF